jgi:hypothetical protein
LLAVLEPVTVLTSSVVDSPPVRQMPTRPDLETSCAETAAAATVIKSKSARFLYIASLLG